MDHGVLDSFGRVLVVVTRGAVTGSDLCLRDRQPLASALNMRKVCEN
jgi:hypothetical protein